MISARHRSTSTIRAARESALTWGAVLLWINGPFGGGKTAAAYELRRRVDQSIVCDPEHLGYGLHRMLPPELRTDFQSLAAWRHGVLSWATFWL
jgi:adenylylsulfate kinase-like enzyme